MDIKNNIFIKGKESKQIDARSASVCSRKTVGLSSWKGQWFLISAVIASGIFLAISFLLRDYFSAPPAANDESAYLDDVKNGALRAVQISCAQQGGVFSNRENLTEYIHFTGQRLGALGYLLNITPKSSINCVQGIENFHVILLKSDKADIWEGSRPEIQQIGDIQFAGGKLIRYTIELEDSMDYDFFINASIYNNTAGLENSKIEKVPAGDGDIEINFAPLDIPQSRALYTIIYSTHLIGKKRWELL